MATFSLLILATLIIPLFGRPAFTVYKTYPQAGINYPVLTFQIADTNVGSFYNMTTNKFTCKVPGTYVFMFTIASNERSHPNVKLVKDGYPVTAAYIDGDSDTNFHQVSTTAILQLSVDDKVWLNFGNTGTVFSNNHKFVSFSGYLLSNAE